MAGGGCSRPRISYFAGKFLHNDCAIRIVLRRELISVGCSDVTPDALRALLNEYDKRFAIKDEEIVLQP